MSIDECRIKEFAKELEANESKIIDELNAAQGKPVNIGAYYLPDEELATKAMRPSKTFNRILDHSTNLVLNHTI